MNVSLALTVVEKNCSANIGATMNVQREAAMSPDTVDEVALSGPGDLVLTAWKMKILLVGQAGR